MFAPRVKVEVGETALLAEFWDCLRLDPRPVSDLRRLLEKHLAQGGAPVLLVDMSGIGFAGSAALGGFVGMRKLGTRVIFYNVEPTVREVFAVTQLEPFFQFATDREAALALAGPVSARLVDDSAPRPVITTVSTPPANRAPSAGVPPLRRLRRTTG